jgi:hypothetical protein
MLRIGIISDTHNLLRPEALVALEGSELILHAGDVCRPEVIEELETIAPVVAVRGNNDNGSWARRLSTSRTIQVGGFRIHILHHLKELDFDPVAEGFHVVVSGHSHRPLVLKKGGVLYLNPGSAGPRRFKLPVTVAMLSVRESDLRPGVIELAV